MYNLLKPITILIFLASSAQAATYEYIFEANFGQRISAVAGDRVSFVKQVWSVILDEEDRSAQVTGTGVGSYRNNQTGEVYGDAIFTLEASIHNLDVGVDSVTGNKIDAVGRANAYGTGTVSLSANKGSSQDSISYDVMAKHANVTDPARTHNYGWLVNSGLFNFILGDTDAGRADVILDAWFHMGMGETVSLFGQDAHLAGDLHSTTLLSKTEVPEPMTSALLLGGLGVISRFRKSTTV